MRIRGIAGLASIIAVVLGALAPFGADANTVVTAAPVAVEVFDRSDGRALAVYEHEGRRYIVGTPGHEYAVRIRNVTARRVLAVTSVDGVNVVTGETAAPDQAGYVLDPWSSVEIAGWRKSLAGTAAFYFTDLGDSYAARTGRPRDVGVIGVAAFYEKSQVAVSRDLPVPLAQAPQPLADSNASAEASAPPAMRREGPAEGKLLAQAQAGAAVPERAEATSKLGTGHGRYEASPVQRVRFERESSAPVQTVSVQYDRHSNLVAMGVLPPPLAARRVPDPFPAVRFVPDPPLR